MTSSTSRSDGPTPRRFRLVAVAAVLALASAAVVVPDLLFGLDRFNPFAQIVSFRPWVLGSGLGLLAATLIVPGFRRRAWPAVAGVAVVLLIGAAMLAPRLVADPVPTGGAPLSVLAFNTSRGGGDAEALASLIRAERPGLVAVSEAGDGYRSRLALLLEPLGYRLFTSVEPGRSDVAGVTAAVAGELADVQVRIGEDSSSFPYLEITGGGLGALRFVAFHAAAPVPRTLPQWQADLALLQQWCGGHTPAIVAGDLNATLDHSALRGGMAGCRDAAEQRGAGLVPTWGPTEGTRFLGPQIDHVLSTGGIAAESWTAHDIDGSDHRAVLARLRVPAR